MEEIKVGEYIRTYDGYIGKIIQKRIHAENKYITDSLPFVILQLNRDFIKHSFNIIDLIEVGDYVNGHKILEIKTNAENGLRYLMYDYVPIKYYVERIDDIKSIVTKEQFENIEYKV